MLAGLGFRFAIDRSQLDVAKMPIALTSSCLYTKQASD